MIESPTPKPGPQRRPSPVSVPPEPPGEFLTPDLAGKVLHLSPRTLEGMRHRGDGPPFAKLGKGQSARILYRRADLDAWVASRLRQSTTEG